MVVSVPKDAEVPKRFVVEAIEEKKAVVVPFTPVKVLKDAPLVALSCPEIVVEPVDETANNVLVAPDVVVELMTNALGSCAEVEATRRPSQVPENGVEVPWIVGPRKTELARVVRVPNCEVWEERFVDEAVVLKELVLVALVVVEFPVTTRLPWMVVEPTVVLPEEVKVPNAPSVEKRLVDDAIELKCAVVVAFVVVEFPLMKRLPPMVEDADARKPPVSVERPVTESVPKEAEVPKRFVLDAIELNRAVVVALVVVELPVMTRLPLTVEEAAMKPPLSVARPFAVNVLKVAPLVALRVPLTVVEPVDEIAKSVVVAPLVVVLAMLKAVGF